MDVLGSSTQCKVKQCSQCQWGTEFYCNTCKHDLCLQCKEKHVINLDTIYHDVIIYREKFKYIPKQEICARHPEKIYEMFCHSCELPVCFQCKEHRNHNILDIRVAYKANRQHYKEIIHNIRSETLYNNSCLLAGIRSDLKTCHTEISNNQTKILIKAQKLYLSNVIDAVMCDVKIRCKQFIQSLQQQRMKIIRHLACIETFEHRSDHLVNRLESLIFLKRTLVQGFKDTPSLTQYALVCLNEDINNEAVTDLLGEIQIIETGKRRV
ncbi:E3 ubiquitin-protein ligase TRIM45-like, partial [Saccostrea cucullata]|uniref:E3 ubiquitin-protein ligase TRIM45-like n=1 Tax=Saccostrea cuccullata TaxID=36930 RepID=UPI002ED19D82